MRVLIKIDRMKAVLLAVFFVFVIILAYFAIWSILGLPFSVKRTEVSFLDVGQGDAMLIESKYGQDILIDGGAGNTVADRLDEEMSFFNRDIELMILSHPHEDHVVGQISVIRERPVRKILYTGVEFDSASYQAWREEIKKRAIETIIIDKQQRVILGPDSYLEIIYPDASLAGKEVKNLNNSSIVLRFVEAGRSFLFVGDIENEVEKELIAKKYPLKADVLKVGHQGSDTSSSDAFLSAVSPVFGVIEVGENKFGHPSPRVLKRMERRGIEILRTDKEGTIVFSIKGTDLSLEH